LPESWVDIYREAAVAAQTKQPLAFHDTAPYGVAVKHPGRTLKTMRTACTSLLAASFAALAIASPACNSVAAELRTLATTPINGLEGLDVAQDGSLYITDAIAHVIHKVDTAGRVSEFSKVGAAVQVILLTSSGAIVTAQERDPDFSAMARPPPPRSDAASAGAPSPAPAPRGFTAEAMGKLGAELILLDKSGKVVRTIRGPEGAFFNGIARIGKNFLIADSASGTIWLYQGNADHVVAWFKNDALLGPNGRFPGANGIKVLKDTVYVSNTAAGTLYKLKTSKGKPVGDLEEFAHVASPDDFDVTKDGNVYLPSEGKVLRISPSGEPTVLADNCKGCDSALLTDHARSLLLLTHGFGPDAGPGHVYSFTLPQP
jgi:sugar lactone lactonase YvrE